MTVPEFSRPWRLDALGAGEVGTVIEADADERRALARRFGLIAVDRLTADYALRRDGDTVIGTGRLSAAVTQACTVTGDPLPARIGEDFALRFVPDRAEGGDEVELDASDCDTIFYTGSAVDLGDAAAETLALALDPFPRGPRAEAALKDAGVLAEGETGPFGGLAALRDKLGKG